MLVPSEEAPIDGQEAVPAESDGVLTEAVITELLDHAIDQRRRRVAPLPRVKFGQEGTEGIHKTAIMGRLGSQKGEPARALVLVACLSD
jgi:hypothetical protein